jgi:hypothetical protein
VSSIFPACAGIDVTRNTNMDTITEKIEELFFSIWLGRFIFTHR